MVRLKVGRHAVSHTRRATQRAEGRAESLLGDLWPVSLLGSEGHVHHVSDGEAGHGALSQRNDLVDALHHRVQLGVSLQRELTADLKVEEEMQTTGGVVCLHHQMFVWNNVRNSLTRRVLLPGWSTEPRPLWWR